MTIFFPITINPIYFCYYQKAMNNFSNNKSEIPKIVTSSTVEVTADEMTITKEFEDFKLNNTSQAQGRRFSVFNKTFDPEDSTNKRSSVDAKIQEDAASLRSSIEDDKSLVDCDDQNLENSEIIKNRFYENHEKLFRKEMSAETRQIIKTTLSSIVLFKQIFDNENDLEQQQVIDSMFERICNRDEIIICQGDEGHYFYVITKGCFDIYVKPAENSRKPSCSNSIDEENCLTFGKKVAQLNNKGYFGELALLYNQVRTFFINLTKIYST